MTFPRPLRNPDVTPIPKSPKEKKPQKPLQRSWIKPSSRARRKRDQAQRYYSEQRDLAFARAGWRCERCGSGTGLITHHKRPRGMGGGERSMHNVENLVVLCDQECHRWVHANPEQARSEGWLI